VDVTLHAGAVPTLDAAWPFAGADVVPGGTLNNLAYVEEQVAFDPEVSRVAQLILADAQTSGGLLISLAAERSDALVAALQARGVTTAALVGEVTGTGTGHITVLP
jgi:selenide,water dikinase